MRIAFDAKRFFQNGSGLGNYSRDLIRILAEYFPNNQYFLLNKKKTERGAHILTNPNVKFVETSKGFLARQLSLGKNAEDCGIDIFHGLSGELPLKWKTKSVKKIVTIHDLIFERYPQYYSFFDRKIHFWKFKKAANSSDLIIAISEQTKKDIIHFLKIDEAKIRVVYQGCHAAFKESLSDEMLNSVKNKFNLPERFLLSVGTIEDRKNLLNVLKALKGTNIPLVVVGKKTEYYKKVKQEIDHNKVIVHFLENVDMNELAAIYKLADIFIYPSFFEGFGIPIIEALYSETPVITSNCSAMPEAGGPGSLYINPKDEKDMRSKIVFLWENEAERERRAEKGLEFVQKFNDEQIASDLMKVYKEVLDKN